jgi:hypothetical protein
MASLRAQDHYKAVTRELRDAGLAWREEFGGKHARLVISVNGREEVETLSISPSDRMAPTRAAAQIRRRIRQWQAEATPLGAMDAASAMFPTLEERTMDDSTFDVVLREIDGEPRTLDIDIGERLGFSRPRAIRQTIERNISALQSFGALATQRGKSRGQEFVEYLLNEEQALYVAAVSDAPRAHDVRVMLIKVFVAWRRGQLQLPEEMIRTFGMAKSLVRDVTELKKSHQEIVAFLTDPRGGLVPAHDLAGTVTASMVIDMAGVGKHERVRGTSAIVTRCLKDFSLHRGFRAYQTPEHIDPSKRWRFMHEAATAWLTGERGVEIIRSHVARQRAKAGRGQLALQLGGLRG